MYVRPVLHEGAGDGRADESARGLQQVGRGSAAADLPDVGDIGEVAAGREAEDGAVHHVGGRARVREPEGEGESGWKRAVPVSRCVSRHSGTYAYKVWAPIHSSTSPKGSRERFTQFLHACYALDLYPLFGNGTPTLCIPFAFTDL